MLNREGNIMTREEATTLLAQVLIDLARNSVHNKRLTDYADELERYIASLEEQEKAEEVENANTEAE
jgi:hypothetical protein